MLLRVFRFDAESDYEYYFKPYEINPPKDASIYELLKLAAKTDRYLKVPENEFYLKINNQVISSNAKANAYIKDNELKLEPLSYKFAQNDFYMDKKHYLKIYEYYFKPLFKDTELANYLALEHLYYATLATTSEPKYMGDSAIIFAYNMLAKYPQFQKELKSIIYSEYGIKYAQDLRPFLASGADELEQIKNTLKAEQ